MGVLYRVEVEIEDYKPDSVRRIKNALLKQAVYEVQVDHGVIRGQGEENQSGSEEDVAAAISLAVWKANRGYCSVNVREIDLGGNDYALDEDDYAKMIANGTHKILDEPVESIGLPATLQARLDRVGEMLLAEKDWPAVIARMDRSDADYFASARRAGDLAVAYGSGDLLDIASQSALDQMAPLWEQLDQYEQAQDAAIRLAEAIFLDPTVDTEAYAVLTEPFVADFPSLASPNPWA
jgi:hypothetical protein